VIDEAAKDMLAAVKSFGSSTYVWLLKERYITYSYFWACITLSAVSIHVNREAQFVSFEKFSVALPK